MYTHTEKYRDLQVTRFAARLIVDRAAGKAILAQRLTSHDPRELTAVLEDTALWFIWDPRFIGTYAWYVRATTVMAWIRAAAERGPWGSDPHMALSLAMLEARCIQDDLQQPDPGIAAEIRAMRDDLLDMSQPDVVQVVLAHIDLAIEAFGHMDQNDPIEDNLSWRLHTPDHRLPHGYPAWDGSPPDIE